jgi:hypothetical protein
MTEYFIYLRYALNAVTYEADAFGAILARANNYLNHRYVVGFKILSPNTIKRCEYMVKKRFYKTFIIDGKESKFRWTTEFECRRKAVVGVLFEKGNKKFTVYLCAEHFEAFLRNTVKYVGKMVANAYDNVMVIVEENNPLYDVDFTGMEHILAGGRGEWYKGLY